MLRFFVQPLRLVHFLRLKPESSFCQRKLKNHIDLQAGAVFFYPKRHLNVDSDYAKFSNPGRLESFFEWATNTTWIEYVEKYFITIHDVTGLDWCSSIVISTILLRALITTPLYIAQTKNSIKYHMYVPVFAQLFKKLSEKIEEAAVKNNWDKDTKQKYFLSNLYVERKKLKKEYKIPGVAKRYLLPFVQIPLWISTSIALRHLSGSLPIDALPTNNLEIIALQLTQEGCLWFSNLNAVDPYFILPIALGIINLSVIEIYRGDGKAKPTGFQKYMILMSRSLSVLLIPIACQLPTAVVLYWFSSSLYGASQALLFRSRKVKTFFRIPYPKNESLTPYRDLFQRLSFKRHHDEK